MKDAKLRNYSVRFYRAKATPLTVRAPGPNIHSVTAESVAHGQTLFRFRTRIPNLPEPFLESTGSQLFASALNHWL